MAKCYAIFPMTLGSFSNACITTKLKPLFKKGSKTDPSNNRPISLLLLLSKVFERVFLDQEEEFQVLLRPYMTISPVLGKTTQQIRVFL